MNLIDSHAHITSSEFAHDIDAVLARAQEAGVSKIFNICTNLEELEKGIVLQNRYSWIHNVAATTPHDVDTCDPSVFDRFAFYARQGLLAAVGETGLDYHYEYSPRQKQIESLQAYMALADSCHLPVVIHCREAFQDLFTLFDGYQGKVLLHCFTGTEEEAQEALRRGFFISLSGIVTFKKSLRLQKVAKTIPLSRLLIETDAPYLAPQGFRGLRNEPAWIRETALFLSQLIGISNEEFISQTSQNARVFFNKSKDL